MPPARPVLILLAIVALPTFFTFCSLLSAHPGEDSETETAPNQRGAFRSFFSFHTPSTLFPPAAIISLTDDNSTFFLARPADFGPRLISKGLSGQLWVGSGFGDDNVRRGGAATGPEGELGCSDVPGWESGDKERHGDVGFSHSKYRKTSLPTEEAGLGGNVGSENLEAQNDIATNKQDVSKFANLGSTDDHLHFPLPETQLSKPTKFGQHEQHSKVVEEHADIQSLQETAEITGKIVMLSRGGCGFLEKVKWAQRRGATALIVGDDTRGGALVTMYARGDTTNVTISSLFTSHTTAHLLSSLIPPEGSGDDDDTEAIRGNEQSQGEKAKTHGDEDRPTFTAALKEPRPTSTTAMRRVSANDKNKASSRRQGASKSISSLRQPSFWQKLGFGRESDDQELEADSRRPPSSGRLSWVNEKFNDELSLEKRNSKGSKSNKQPKAKSKTPAKNQHTSGDGFEIGIQDWRDPDLVATKATDSKDSHQTTTMAAMPTSSDADAYKSHDSSSSPKGGKAFSGGSITPGSGEYGHNPSDLGDTRNQEQTPNGDHQGETGWLSHALWGDEPEHATKDIGSDLHQSTSNPSKNSKLTVDKSHIEEPEHEGLWVTLSPTTMSTTPFFDTLLVLVASPLITLTVVYALLLLRSRIRRRRWRAPKSVVERLPIRTYQTMPTSSTTSSARMATPFTSSPTSPLLQSRTQSIHSRSRAQSKAGSEAGDQVSLSLDKATAQAVAKDNEKSAREAAKKKKKYSGRQVECVVCLEEYVEGYSQVMSLPCGHEFHAECITPWLTTRRRTCPICKNDVVRSMARSPSAQESPSATPYHDSPRADDVQVLAAETTNESPSAAIPIPRDNDVERGDDMAETLVEDRSGRRGWRGLASFSLSAFSGEAAWRRAQADRDR
ncbi:MAG: hypothetical protein Q9195_009305 [Heterodermia aff. obscurata]